MVTEEKSGTYSIRSKNVSHGHRGEKLNLLHSVANVSHGDRGENLNLLHSVANVSHGHRGDNGTYSIRYQM